MENKAEKRGGFTEEAKQSLLARWSASGQTAKEFAQAQGIGMSTLFKWRRDIKGQSKAIRPFVPVRVREPEVARYVEIHGPNGLVVRINEQTNFDLLPYALRAIVQCGS